MISDDSIDYQCRIALENPKAIIEESEIQRLESKLDDQLLKIYHHGWVIGKLHHVTCCDIDWYRRITNSYITEAVEALQVNCDEQLVVETLITLRTNPDLVVQVLKLLNNQNAAYDFLELCFSSAYGAGILKDDEDFCMLLYKSLLDTNWLSPFVRMFSIRRFCCQGFFICALREPMLNVLAEDDWYLDIDRDSILSHFTQSEITKRFGDDDTFEIRLQTYTDIMSRKLASLCVGFLERMLFNLTALPKCIRQMLREYFILSKNENEVIRMFVVDVMGNYLHDPIGSDLVDNTFITAIAQYNINQISSLLLEYLTSSSLPSSMKSKFTNTINYLFAEEKNQFRSKLLDIIGSSIDTLPLDDNNDVYLPRESFLLTYNEVHNLFDYLFTLNGVTSGNLQDLISALPSKTQMKQLFDIRTNDAIGSGRIIHGERILVFRLPLSSTENAKSAPYNTLSRSSKLVTSSDVSKRLRFSMNENKDNYRQISYSSSILEFPQSESVGSAGPISVDDTGSSDDVIGTGSVEGIDKTSVEVDLDMLSGRESPNNGYESSGRCSVNSAFIGNEATSIMNGPNVTEKFNMFDLPKSQCQDEYKLAQSDNWSTVVGASDCDPTERVNRLCDIVEENPIVQDLIRMHPQRLTSRESDLWSIEPSVSENVTSLDGKSDESFEAFRLIDDDFSHFNADDDRCENTNEVLCGLEISLSKWSSMELLNTQDKSSLQTGSEVRVNEMCINSLKDTLTELLIQTDAVRYPMIIDTFERLKHFLEFSFHQVVRRGDFRRQIVLSKATHILPLLEEDSVNNLLSHVHRITVMVFEYFKNLNQRRQRLLDGLQYATNIKRSCERMYIAVISGILMRIAMSFLSRNEAQMKRFTNNFVHRSTITDRVFYLRKFLRYLYETFELNVFQVKAGYKESDLECCFIFIERSVVSRIYNLAIYPNGQTNIDGDRFFSQQLSSLVKDDKHIMDILNMSQLKERVIPWSKLISNIAVLNSFKTSRDKMKRILYCIDAVEDTWRNAQIDYESTDIVTAMEILIIKANCPALLSNFRYINQYKSSSPIHDFSSLSAKWSLFETALLNVRKRLNDCYKRIDNRKAF